MNNRAVFGIYKTRFAVEHAVDELKLAGFGAGEISVLLPKKKVLKISLMLRAQKLLKERLLVPVQASSLVELSDGLLVSVP